MDIDMCLMEPSRRVQMVSSGERRKSRIRMNGPDGGWAWCVALSACSINFIMAGLGRMSGILYVAIIEQFGVNRKAATAPFSTRSSTRNLLGPVVGILGQQFSVRTVSIAGGIVGTISSAACYFAPDVTWITILWGGFNGFGTAMTMTLAQVVIGQHFVTYRTTASGLAFSGGCVGSFVFPVLIEYLLQNYGMQGTFLILSGVIMHVIPAAMMLKKPSWTREGSVQSTSRIPDESNSQTNPAHGIKEQNGHLAVNSSPEDKYTVDIYCDGVTNADSSQQRFYWFEQDIDLVAQVTVSALRNAAMDFAPETLPQSLNLGFDEKDVCDTLNFMFHVAMKRFESDFTSPTADTSEAEAQTRKRIFLLIEKLKLFSLTDDYASMLCVQECPNYKQTVQKILSELFDVYSLYLETGSMHSLNVVPVVDDQMGNQSKSWFERLKDHIKTSITLNANPLYALISFCRAMHFMTYVPAITVIVDFSMDKGLPEADGKFVIAALSAGDLVGRLCSGWITDRGYISLPKYMFINMIIQGATSVALPQMPSRWSLMLMFAIFGMLEGSLFIRHAVLISLYVDDDEQSIAMGSMNFLSGLLGLGLPYYIGYFRDTLGSYNLMFYITGVISSFTGIFWVFEPQFVKCISKRKNKRKADSAGLNRRR